jgi:hypothetical protein
MKELFDQFSNQSSIMKKTIRKDGDDAANQRPSISSLMSPSPQHNSTTGKDDFNEAREIIN